MKQIKIILAAVVLLIAVFSPVRVLAADLGQTACEGANLAGTNVNCADGQLSDNSMGDIVKKIINILSIVVGVAAVVMIIIGGFRYIISGGDSTGVTGAKNTIMYAIIGLIIVLFAQVIVRFVFTNATKTSQPSGSNSQQVKP